MKNFLITSMLLGHLSFAGAIELKGQAQKTPWGGYWWSMRNAEIVRGWEDGNSRKEYSVTDIQEFTKCLSLTTSTCNKLIDKYSENQARSLSPLMKFDLWVKKKIDKTYGVGNAPTYYSKASINELEIHYIQDPSHPHWEARGFAGKCTGWSLANIDFSEPTKDKLLDGVAFTPSDIKAILAAIYNGAQFFVPDELALGNAYRASGDDASEENYNDPSPHILISALEEHIGKNKKIIVADMDPGEGVWNHPLYKYEIKISKVTTTHKGQMTLYYANDEVEIDEVFSNQSRRADLLSRTLDFELKTKSNWNGKMDSVISSRWVGESQHKHPDSLVLGIEKNWRKDILQYKNTAMKQEVNFQLLKKINLNNGWISAVDMLLENYYK